MQRASSGGDAAKNAIMILLLMAAPASAHGWRATCPECDSEVCRARALARLDCGELGAVVEAKRQFTNQRILMQYNRWYSAAPVPQAAPLFRRATRSTFYA